MNDAMNMDRASLTRLIKLRVERIKEQQEAHPENRKMEKEFKRMM